jgi:hypothetical protein
MYVGIEMWLECSESTLFVHEVSEQNYLGLAPIYIAYLHGTHKSKLTLRHNTQIGDGRSDAKSGYSDRRSVPKNL